MKVLAGGKPWRRKPSEAPAVSAARTPAALRSSERAMIARATAEITQTPAARPSTPSIRLITLITATMPTTVPTSPRSTAPPQGRPMRSTEAGIERAEEGEGEALDRDAGGDGDDHGDDLAEQLPGGAELVDVVEDADHGDHDGAGEDRPGLGVPGKPDQRRDGDRDEDREAAEPRGRRFVQRAFVGQVDRPDATGEAVGEGHEEQRQDPGEEKGEAARRGYRA